MKQIFVHGLGQTPESWEKTIELLGNNEDIICPDLSKLVRGNDVNYANLYKVFSEICDQSDEPVDICGLSLGGVMALNYAIDHPDKIRSLVLIATQYKMPKKLLKFQNAIFRIMPSSAFQQMGFGKAEFLQLCSTMMELDFSKALEKVTCPVLVICGEKDTANKKASIELADRLPNAELCLISGVKHEINMEEPEKLAEVLQKFL